MSNQTLKLCVDIGFENDTAIDDINEVKKDLIKILDVSIETIEID